MSLGHTKPNRRSPPSNRSGRKKTIRMGEAKIPIRCLFMLSAFVLVYAVSQDRVGMMASNPYDTFDPCMSISVHRSRRGFGWK